MNFIWALLLIGSVPSTSQDADTVWHKWNTDNFSIVSIDKAQGYFVYKNIEKIKSWIFTRWGLPNIKFSKECRIFCVPTTSQMNTLFKINSSYVVVKQELSVIWLVFDKLSTEVIPGPLSLICFVEYPFWAKKGMSSLNETPTQIKQMLGGFKERIDAKQDIYFSDALFSMTEDQWNTLTDDNKKLYNNGATALCLLLRKEFGQDAFLQFLKTNSEEASFVGVYGFSGFEQFDITFQRYVYNLSKDIEIGKTPNKYLTILKKE
jgi:hypothetical protein